MIVQHTMTLIKCPGSLAGIEDQTNPVLLRLHLCRLERVEFVMLEVSAVVIMARFEDDSLSLKYLWQQNKEKNPVLSAVELLAVT